MDLIRLNDLTNPADLARLNQWLLEANQKLSLTSRGRSGGAARGGGGGGGGTVTGGGGGGGGGTTTVLTNLTGENLTGQVDGANMAFTLTYTPSPAAASMLLYNGNFLIQPTHYSISGTTATTVFAPNVGDNLYIIYPYQPVATLGQITGEDLTSQIDGATATFVLTYTPSVSAALIIMYNGNFQVPVAHYTQTATTVALTFTPSVGDNLYAIYPR